MAKQSNNHPTPPRRIRVARLNWLSQFKTVARSRLNVLRSRLAQQVAALRQTAAANPVAGPVLRWLERVGDVITPLGRWSLLALLLALPTALACHWQEAWALSLVLATMLLLALPTVIGRRSYDVGVSLAANRVIVGEAAFGEVRLSNPSSRGVGSASVELPVGTGLAVFNVPRLAGKTSHQEVFTIPTRRRGVIVVGPVTSVRGDPLGLLRRKQRWNEPVELFVHPRTTTIDAEAIGFIRDNEGAVTQELSSSDVAFHALRDYTPGDDRRNVHWRSTARTGRLMVRQFEETRRAHLLVVLDLDTEAWRSADEFETGVSCAASLVLAAYRAGREVSLVTQAGMPVAPNAMRALDAITRLEQLRTTNDLSVLARQASRDVPQASVVTLVTGAALPAVQLHRAHCELPSTAYSIGLRIEKDAALSSTQVGGLRLFTLGALEALPQTMRRAAL
ncbi:Uncharacterized conserved protein (some members contain a von Willebrand factor type A (vWA) domain) [Actinomyces bovis]|uniref:Uncharacterized conserved protein (Some members contain a von Willebrand factor type A (VWA) domain) n=1 Tax=Actinomyces bovis TaxID=1658 RepID=A0ABY1VLJ5_9ACTO|nr:DUF58 domain-containing protein [Actinomyces bovis]SPT52960.1 Uncharacterized conserved protein (some members contain a von Willebrand factor type A (vWA) domain) [Actinomyces bovis]VEG55159.1 Uncharacterized conserved protein (some members contain a von Willebrand factor type A (vWA) domain) [Actinomyces israelii]